MFNHPMSHLQLKQLRQLIAVAENGSIRAAAKQLSIAQPALSRSIRAIEDDLQVKLMERGPRGIVLTKYGETLCNYARIIDANLRFAAEEFDDIRGARSGTVRMGIGPHEGFTIAHLAIDRMFERRPNLDVTLVDGDFEVLAARLLAGEIDFILGPAPLEGVTPGLTREILANIRPVVVVRSQHPLAGKQSIDIEQLVDVDWILPGEGTNARTRLNNTFWRHGLVPPDGPISAYPSMTAVALVKQRDLVAILPRQLIDEDRKAGLIKVLPVASEDFLLPVRLTTREFGRLSPACRDMIAEIKKVCEDIGDQL